MTRARVIRVLIALAAAIVLLFGAIWLFQRKLIYLPDTSPVPPAGEILPGATDIVLRTSDGLDLGAWLVPPSGPGSYAVVLVANGNAGNRASRAPLAAALSRAGLAVLLFDYRGYGGNSGSPSEDGLEQDARAAHRYLTEDLQVPASQLIYYGESLGSAVVTELAVEHPPAGMVLRSPFTDLATTGQEHYPFLPVRLMLRDTFPVAENITRVKAPITVVLGTADSIVPPGQSRDVAKAGSARLVEIPGADHNDRILLDGPQLIDAVTALLPS
ncbi:alpha-beta hydrolase superfamily lysophospholipase [Kibdelosporangium banguiense]|uniref:Alpha-beta hydrolase superfamily lysophospholipase n=1 Tax=Kibdelosporangium banguiense TaxID=1365924 RepID=A0ABS4TSX9_9PSEU|nr:alpha/beta fold hydrolase [Kibdelosporangium banguiense]MBP2327513.1 alpha-beta hydrolase superfamily lysophospholipase [Kibdelosporangium banguiense]